MTVAAHVVPPLVGHVATAVVLVDVLLEPVVLEPVAVPVAATLPVVAEPVLDPVLPEPVVPVNVPLVDWLLFPVAAVPLADWLLLPVESLPVLPLPVALSPLFDPVLPFEEPVVSDELPELLLLLDPVAEPASLSVPPP